MAGLLSGFMSIPLMSIVGWAIIPDFATKHVLSFLHRSFLRSPPPPQGTRAYHQHYALTFALVVLGYLFYNLVSSARETPSNFYEILGVGPTVDETGLKLAFRQFVKRNHPDRPDVGREGEELFIVIRDVYEALKDPVVRFAYDRFGPDVLRWSQCTTTREYIQTGLMQSSGYHIVVGIALVFWSAVGASSSVSFWRYLLYAALFVAEISLILSPSPSMGSPSFFSLPSPSMTTYTTHTILHSLFPNRLIHQHIRFLHQLFLFLSIALSRVVPVLVSAFGPPQMSQKEEKEVIERILALSGVADREGSIMLHTLLHSVMSPAERHEMISSLARPRPFEIPHGLQLGVSPGIEPTQAVNTPATQTLQALAKEIEELVIEANIKKEDGPLRSVWEAAITRGRTGKHSRKSEEKKNNFWEAEESGGSETEHEESGDIAAGEDGGDARRSLPSPVTPTMKLEPLPMSPRTPRSPGRARSVSY
ncbi:hypothetical protein BDZ94DRAFT_1297784 [Collybia nuda]|uniref:J domain-containing protein n=1 Tax=Collybia nuda TaxID=64659 RepID=A0A9P6CF20_9AGAR|nr:hypothetical protein BDZ94DRAFT_1297784 [Collybia nuda]